MPDNRERGLYGKYRVERMDGQELGRCLVLELKDPNTWDAALAFANSVEDDGYGPLASDVRSWVDSERSLRGISGS